MDLQIKVALITGFFTLSSAIITATIAALISRRWLNQEKLKEQLETAKKDIEFLLLLEDKLYEDLQVLQNMKGSPKLKYRALMFRRGYKFSGKFTLSRVRT
jgi:hypothetical protein